MTLGNDNGTDGQTDRRTDRVRRNMRPPPREEGRIIRVVISPMSVNIVLLLCGIPILKFETKIILHVTHISMPAILIVIMRMTPRSIAVSS